MDKLTEEQLDSLHLIAAATDGYKPEDGCTSLRADYNNELLIYTDGDGEEHVINCCMDSWYGIVKDFVRQLLTKKVQY